MRTYAIVVAMLLGISQGCIGRDVYVASGGGFALTPDDLRLEVYKMGPSFKFSDTYDERKKLVDVLAARYYLAEEAMKMGFGDEGLAEEASAAEAGALADAYRKWKIEKAVRVPRVASKPVLQNLDRELHVREMSFAVYQIAEEGLRDLRSGQKFDALAASVADRPDIRVSDHGWKFWRNFDRSVAYQVYQLRPGEVTGIVNLKTGYSIFYLVEDRPWGESPELIYLRSKRFVRALKEAELKVQERAELSKMYHVVYSEAGIGAALRAFSMAFAAERPPDSLLAIDLLSYTGGGMNVAYLFSYYFSLPPPSQPYVGDAHAIEEFALDALMPELESMAGRALGFDRLPEVIWSVKKAREEFLIPSMEEYFKNQITVSPNDRVEYYETHKAEMITPQQYRARRILLDSQEAAREVMKELRSGRDFAEVASERSLDQYTSSKGGDLGYLAGGVIAAYDSALAGVEVGGFTRPFQTPDGVEILKLEEKEESRQISFEEACAFLDDTVASSQANQLLSNWVDSRKRETGYTVSENLLRRISLPEPAWKKGIARESRMGAEEGKP